MMDITSPVARRSFVASISVGAAALGAGLGSRAAAEQPAAMPAHWKPAYDAQDDWMELPGKHRFIFDALSPKGAGEAIFFANNHLVYSKSGYGLEPKDNAVIVVMRHFATPFAYTDAMWAKYGAAWGKLLKYDDPETKKIALRNTLMTAPKAEDPDAEVSIPIMVKKDVHFAVCGAATTLISTVIAKETKEKAEDIYADLAANLVANAHMVPAGIIAVNRAQERGYAFAYVG